MSALAKWFCGSAPVEHKVLLMGDYECGKTTFLDRLKFEQVRKHLNHTVNVNVETVEYPKDCNWHIWEIGGDQKSRQLAWHHLSPATLVIYLHDCGNPADRVPVSFSFLLRDMANIGAKYIWIAFNKQADWGFKRGRINTLRQEYEKVLENYRGRISGKVLTHRLDAKSAEGAFNVLEDMFVTMRDHGD